MRTIPTMYCGIEFRSRLEARWASFFRGIGWEYTYEPFDGNGYIPDFLIHGERPLLVEVKPAVTKSQYEAPIAKVEQGLLNVWNGDVLIVGADPLPRVDLGQDSAMCDWHPSAGILGQWMGGQTQEDNKDDPFARFRFPDEWSWEDGLWFQCRECPRSRHGIGVYHSIMSFVGVPCSHYDGNNHLAGIDHREISSVWAAACNDVKWRGSAT